MSQPPSTDRKPDIATEDATLLQLLRVAAKPNPRVFHLFVQRYQERLWRVAYRVLEDGAEAEDVVQDVLITLWKKRHEVEPEQGSLKSWLHKVTFHRALDVKRARARRPGEELPEEQLVCGDDMPDHTLVKRQEHAHIYRAVCTLPEGQMHALWLYYFRETPVLTISRQLGTTEVAVRSLLKRGKHQLRQRLNAAAQEAKPPQPLAQGAYGFAPVRNHNLSGTPGKAKAARKELIR